MAPDARVSLTDLQAAGIRLRPSEAVAIVREVARLVSAAELPGVPSAHVLRFTAGGDVTVEGPIAADGPEIARTAYLLESLMAASVASQEPHMPGALRLVIARATGSIDLPPYSSLDSFAQALARFADRDVREAVREIHATWAAAVESGAVADPVEVARPVPTSKDPLTISDIRRARRSTRLTLEEVSQRCHIPAWLLRELEWGYFRNWPAGLYGRTQLVRYARAAGLDEDLVVRTVWPLLEETARARGRAVVAPRDLEPADPQQAIAASAGTMLVPVRTGPLVALAAPIVRQYRPSVAALAIAALLFVALLPAIWRSRAQDPPATAPRPPSTAATPPAPRGDAARATGARPAAPAVAVGTAMFDTADAAQSGDRTGDTPSRAAMLRITRIVDDGANYSNARLSHDGKRIAFDSDRDGARAVYVANADGRNIRRVTDDGYAAMPSWSPDGRTVAFVRAETDRPDVHNLWIADVDNRSTRRLTSHRTGRVTGASWFPDGRRLAYALASKLIVLDTESGRTREFRSPVPERVLDAPAVGPRGRRVIFNVQDAGAWILELPRGAMRRVLSDPTAQAYSWAADGRRVAFHSGQSNTWGVLVMDSHN